MNPKNKIHSSWLPLIDSIIEADSVLKELNTSVLPNVRYYPEVQDIFNVFQMPVEDIKVVILGQDPYPNEGQAIGYAFAVSEETTIPASLRIIQREVGHNIDKTLQSWREQGVFLLNTALTVEAKNAGSHLQYWENFTQKVLGFISKTNPCIWLLWGKKAQVYKSFLESPTVQVTSIKTVPTLGTKINHILVAAHPAAETYSGGTAGFLGCNHFNIVNEILRNTNKSTINW